MSATDESRSTPLNLSGTLAEGLDEVSGVAPTLQVSAAGRPSGQFGRYRIVKQLGQGGMGTVYLAHDEQLDRPVVLKVPRFSAAADAEILGRFLREARAAATLQHPNICAVYDVGQIDGIHYLSMAYLEGQPLSKLIETHPRLAQRGVADLVRKLALALHEAHAHGVVHRDLKPANIIINLRHEPVVMDFGLARRAGSNDPRLTAPGAIMGTPAYMSPEQLLGDDQPLDPQPLGPSCDIYSLGVILYELLTGRLPFEGSLLQILSQIPSKPPLPPSQLRPDLDTELVSICLRAMNKRIEGRFASMQEFADALSAYLGYHHETVRLDGDPTDRVPATIEQLPATGETRAGLVRADQPTTRNAAAQADERLGPASQLLAELMARMPAESASQGRGEKGAGRGWLWGVVAVLVVAVLMLSGVVLMNWKGNAGQQVSVHLDLSTIVYNTEVTYYLDGRPVARGQLEQELSLAVGDHKLEIKRGDELLETRSFVVEAGDARQTVAVSEPRAPRDSSAEESPETKSAASAPFIGKSGSTTPAMAAPVKAVEPGLAVWVKKDYNSPNPLHSVLAVNGRQAAKFESDAQQPIAKLFQPGWNQVTLDTAPAYPAADSNVLAFNLGPVVPDADGKEVMSPVLWHFRNGDNWKFQNGKFSHQLGPTVGEVRLALSLYYAGLEFERQEVKAGDFVLAGAPNYGSYNPSVTATAILNGRPFNSFAVPGRQVVVTSLLKQGHNDFRLITKRVENCLEDNDVHISLSGPAEWNAHAERFEMRPIAWFSSLTGWRRNKQTAQLVNTLDAQSDTIERGLPVYLRQAPRVASKWTGKPALSVFVSRNYSGYENPLHSELQINGQVIGLFTSDSRELIAQALKQGAWNDVTLRTTRQQPAADINHLLFQLGPAQRDNEGKLQMSPVLWSFENGDSWKYQDGKLVHALGKDTSEVMLSFRLFYAGLDQETREVTKGDYVLSGAPNYGSSNPSVISTVTINGQSLSTFTAAPRQIVITPFLKPGVNEIRLVTARVKNCLEDNDLKFSVGGPAEYDVGAGKFTFPVIRQFDGLTGWTRNKQSGQLVSSADPSAETIEQVISFEIAKP